MEDNSGLIVKHDMEVLEKQGLPYEKFKDCSILVTGASGMLAAYMISFFMYLNEKRKYDIKVLALVRNREKAERKFHAFLQNTNFQLIIQDVCDPIDLKQKIDYIFHMAGNASPYYILNDPVGIIKANTLGTLNILMLAKKCKTKKVLYASTREVYGKMPDGTKEILENSFGSLDPMEFRACYPESKRMAETLFQSYYHQYKVPFTIVRIAHSYGPGMSIENDGRVMADFISDVVHERNIILKSTGDAERAFCYITDAVSGMLFAILKGKDGEAYNIANESEALPIKEVAHILCGLYPEKGLKVIFDIPETMSAGYSRMGRIKLNTDKLRKLGWECKVTLREGLRKTVDSFKMSSSNDNRNRYEAKKY